MASKSLAHFNANELDVLDGLQGGRDTHKRSGVRRYDDLEDSLKDPRVAREAMKTAHKKLNAPKGDMTAKKAKARSAGLELMLCHVRVSELKALDMAQGGAHFDEKTGLRSYKPLGEKLVSDPAFLKSFLEGLSAGQSHKKTKTINVQEKQDGGVISPQKIRAQQKKARAVMSQAIDHFDHDFKDAAGDKNPKIKKIAEMGEGYDTRLAMLPKILVDLLNEVRGEQRLNKVTGLPMFMWGRNNDGWIGGGKRNGGGFKDLGRTLLGTLLGGGLSSVVSPVFSGISSAIGLDVGPVLTQTFGQMGGYTIAGLLTGLDAKEVREGAINAGTASLGSALWGPVGATIGGGIGQAIQGGNRFDAFNVGINSGLSNVAMQHILGNGDIGDMTSRIPGMDSIKGGTDAIYNTHASREFMKSLGLGSLMPGMPGRSNDLKNILEKTGYGLKALQDQGVSGFGGNNRDSDPESTSLSNLLAGYGDKSVSGKTKEERGIWDYLLRNSDLALSAFAAERGEKKAIDQYNKETDRIKKTEKEDFEGLMHKHGMYGKLPEPKLKFTPTERVQHKTSVYEPKVREEDDTYTSPLVGHYKKITSRFERPLSSVSSAKKSPSSVSSTRSSRDRNSDLFLIDKNDDRDILAYAKGGQVRDRHAKGELIQGKGKGQEDLVKTSIPAGSYIIDATTTAHFGDGSTRAGGDILKRFEDSILKDLPSPIKTKLHQHVKKHHKNVPVLLSDAEYRFSPLAVTALGAGSNEVGAKKLKSMVENLRKHKAQHSHKTIPPKARDPLNYIA